MQRSFAFSLFIHGGILFAIAFYGPGYTMRSTFPLHVSIVMDNSNSSSENDGDNDSESNKPQADEGAVSTDSKIPLNVAPLLSKQQEQKTLEQIKPLKTTASIPAPKPVPLAKVRPLPQPSEAKANLGGTVLDGHNADERHLRGEEKGDAPNHYQTSVDRNGGMISSTRATRGVSYHLGDDKTPVPDYPWSARRRGREGRVVVEIVVSEKGDPLALTLIESAGDDALDRAALEGLRRWRLQPALDEGRAVKSIVRVPIRFQLRADSSAIEQ